jgi:hypothetical protein
MLPKPLFLAVEVVMRAILISIVSSLLFFTDAFAQTVSIISQGQNTESILVEASMKRNLRAEGYTVKGESTEGVVLILEVMPLHNRAGYATGVAGHVTIVALGWQDFADLVVSKECKQEHELAQKVKDYLGSRLIFLDENMAVASDEEGLAELLATYSNKVIRATFEKMTDFIHELDKRTTEPSPDVINPVR